MQPVDGLRVCLVGYYKCRVVTIFNFKSNQLFNILIVISIEFEKQNTPNMVKTCIEFRCFCQIMK